MNTHPLYLLLIIILLSQFSHATTEIEQWDFYEWSHSGPSKGNPYRDVTIQATFRLGENEFTVSGFYDGEGIYRCRFMPNVIGNWHYEISSNVDTLNGHSGTFTCVAPEPGNEGGVSVANQFHFEYTSGKPYFCFGTTAYAWQHQSAELREQTLVTFEKYGFNKVRMCVFPKRFAPYITNEPEHYPYMGEAPDQWDFSRFNPAFFRHLERSILELQKIGVEADLILFHPYDESHWGFDHMSLEEDIFYLEYLIARLASFRNVWWSLANEWDLVKTKNVEDWNTLIETVDRLDIYDRLISIHNAGKIYDHSHPSITHLSLQRHNPKTTPSWHEQYGKPVVFDEMSYEGNLGYNYGDLTGELMTMRFWICITQAGYGTHGEMYQHPENILYWSKGGVTHGSSPARIRFLREIVESTFTEGPMRYPTEPWWNRKNCVSQEEEAFLFYYEDYQPSFRPIRLPEGNSYTIDVIDTWEMTINRLPGLYSGSIEVPLPGKPYIAVRAMKAN